MYKMKQKNKVYQTLGKKKEQKHDLVCLNLHITKPQKEKEGW